MLRLISRPAALAADRMNDFTAGEEKKPSNIPGSSFSRRGAGASGGGGGASSIGAGGGASRAVSFS